MRLAAVAAVAAVASIAAGLVGACGKRGTPAPGAPPADAATVTGRDAAVPSAPPDAAVVSPPQTVRVPDETRQLVTAVVPRWDATTAELRLWTRAAAHDRWQPAGPAWPAVIGTRGLAWGRGIHGDGAPAGRPGAVKAEGDGKSPAGLFALGPVYGYAAAAPPGARVAYTALDDAWRCVDDAASTFYNRVLDQRAVASDWSSAEVMRRDDALYTWVVDVRHNPAATPGGGSCIFLHVWSGPRGQTVGCTAMAEPALAALIAALDPAARPVFAMLPAAEYAALAAAWGLPER